MAYDGIVTFAMVKELQSQLLLGKIDKIYQPVSEELVFVVHTKAGNKKLLLSSDSNASRVHLIEDLPQNPPQPLAFCMLMRKHLSGARIIAIEQKGSERIIEISLETLNELGFTVNKKLVCEIMGRHSNITLVDVTTGKIIDSIKRVSIDMSRIRQLLPGKLYEYPPAQDKVPFKEARSEDFVGPALKVIGGIAPCLANELDEVSDPFKMLQECLKRLENGVDGLCPTVYLDEDNVPKEFYPFPLSNYEGAYSKITFETLSEAIDYYFEHKAQTNRIRQKSSDLIKQVQSALDKAMLKKQRLLEDIHKAENSEDLRLYGEILTANLHKVERGAKSVKLQNYYDGSDIVIPLDERYSPAKNAQLFFKKYGKLKNSIKEKESQLEISNADISYLESVLSFLDSAKTPDEVDAIRVELTDTGYIRRRKSGFKDKKYKAQPLKAKLPNGMELLIGKNNRENDFITTKLADKTDVWLHTKDIPGSHVIIRTGGIPIDDIDEENIHQAAAIAAFHSKAKSGSKVPVDYVQVKYVKKPAGAKPGMVIFTHNRTVFVDPKEE